MNQIKLVHRFTFLTKAAVLFLGLVFLTALSHAGNTTIEGTLKSKDGNPITGEYPYRIQFFSNDAGGTPISEALDGVTTFSAKGEFKFEVPVPPPSDLAPEVWFMLMVDLDRDGFDQGDLHSGGYFDRRLKIGTGPYHLTVKEKPAASSGPRVMPPGVLPDPSTISAMTRMEGCYNVKDFGAVGNGKIDDTTAIQNAINVASQMGGIVYLPPGHYSISSLDLTRATKVTLTGAGPLSSHLVANTDDAIMLDMTGAMYMRIENLMMSTGQAVPKVGFLLGQTPNWSANAHHLMNLYVTGKYSVATVYVHGCQSSDMMNCDFYNYQPTDAPVLAFTASNYAGVKSPYAKTIEAMVTTSDWTIVACEIHSFAAVTGGSSLAPAVRLDGTHQMRWFGGNISGSGPEYVKMSGSNQFTIFEGTTFYSDNGTPTNTIIYNGESAIGLTISQCHLQSSESVLGGADNAVYDVVNLCSPLMQQPYLINCPQGKLSNAMIYCHGAALKVGSIKATLLINPGTITAQDDTSMKVMP